MKFRGFDVKAIRRTLEEFKEAFDSINDRLENRREKMTSEIIDNIVEAYDYLNDLLEKEIELFSPAGLYSMLELNHIVLCGKDPRRRAEYFNHIQETRRRFQSLIHDILAWYDKKGRTMEPFKRASRFYVRALSQPQLFIEGNHRTENIIVNYLLFTNGIPPFILSVSNALAYLNPSSRIKFSSKRNMLENVTAVPGYEKDFRSMLEKYVDSTYVV